MAKKILINAKYPEEVRVAVVEEGVLKEVLIEGISRRSILGNIYKGRVVHIEPSLQAAFVEFGEAREGFLPLGEVHSKWWSRRPSSSRPRIQEVLGRGQEVVVQVSREEVGTKRAVLTTYLSLPGRYLVLLSGKEITGVSLKIEDEEQRKRLRKIISQFSLPSGMGMIARTAAAHRTKKDISRDFDYLLRLWEAIKGAEEEAPTPALLYQESDVVIKAIREYFSHDVREVIIDEEGAYGRAQEFFQRIMPKYRRRVKYYDDPLPLFSRYQVEDQIEEALCREVPLRSGGKICIDVTEALVAIDVNSGRVQHAKNVEETALITNLEAAEEIARQVRLRELGGLIVIDFIDMRSAQHRREVERRIKKAFKGDRAKVDFSRISSFGIMEISRQRMRPPLSEGTYGSCRCCAGTGRVRSPVSSALMVLRRIGERAITQEGLKEVKVTLPPAAADYLLKNKREDLKELERGYHLKISIKEEEVPAPVFEFVREEAIPWYKRLLP